MKVSYSEGLATHTGPESCGAAREGGDEAWTGERTGRVFSREKNLLRDADAVEEETAVGAPGSVAGVTAFDAAEAGPAPTPLVALTVKV